MDEQLTKIALIPAYKPDEKLAETAKQLKDKGLIVVIVDDGSGKEYRNFFDSASEFASVISYPDNHGKGYALKTGIKKIIDKFKDNYAVVTVDADGQHSTEDALTIIRTAEINRSCLILGSRKFKGDIPLRSKFGNNMTRSVFHAMTRVHVSDTQTGLRAFSSDIAEYLTHIKGDRYEYEMNMLMKCTEDNIDIIEIPIRTIYIDDNSSSHFDPVNDSIRIYKNILKFKTSKGE